MLKSMKRPASDTTEKKPVTDTIAAKLVKKGVETRKGMDFTKRDKDIAEVNAALADPLATDPDFKGYLLQLKSSLARKGYTEPEIKARIIRATTEQSEKEKEKLSKLEEDFLKKKNK
jgi:hypothetical protein